MFPTSVGMNRFRSITSSRKRGVPHERGDEPFGMSCLSRAASVFPTSVGMNRR